MIKSFSQAEIKVADLIVKDLVRGQIGTGIERLRMLKEEIHAAIPEKVRIGRGITWVVEREARLLAVQGLPDESLKDLAWKIYSYLNKDDLLIGVAIFLMAEYGQCHPTDSMDFFRQAAGVGNWIVREFAQGAFRKMIKRNKDIVQPWLKSIAQSKNHLERRFASETLRPVTHNKWLFHEPEYSLDVLRLMFRETHTYPRTSVGNNLSDLSRRQAELIYSVVDELVAMDDVNSRWIAYRACRNLVKNDPVRVMDLLNVNEYHYKDRNIVRQ